MSDLTEKFWAEGAGCHQAHYDVCVPTPSVKGKEPATKPAQPAKAPFTWAGVVIYPPKPEIPNF